jgi:hypothetical protein
MVMVILTTSLLDKAPTTAPHQSAQAHNPIVACVGACISMFSGDRLLAQVALMEGGVAPVVTAFHYVMFCPLVFVLVFAG